MKHARVGRASVVRVPVEGVSVGRDGPVGRGSPVGRDGPVGRGVPVGRGRPGCPACSGRLGTSRRIGRAPIRQGVPVGRARPQRPGASWSARPSPSGRHVPIGQAGPVRSERSRRSRHPGRSGTSQPVRQVPSGRSIPTIETSRPARHAPTSQASPARSEHPHDRGAPVGQAHPGPLDTCQSVKRASRSAGPSPPIERSRSGRHVPVDRALPQRPERFHRAGRASSLPSCTVGSPGGHALVGHQGHLRVASSAGVGRCCTDAGRGGRGGRCRPGDPLRRPVRPVVPGWVRGAGAGRLVP